MWSQFLVVSEMIVQLRVKEGTRQEFPFQQEKVFFFSFVCKYLSVERRCWVQTVKCATAHSLGLFSALMQHLFLLRLFLLGKKKHILEELGDCLEVFFKVSFIHILAIS